MALRIIDLCPQLVESQDCLGRTPLHYAICLSDNHGLFFKLVAQLNGVDKGMKDFVSSTIIIIDININIHACTCVSICVCTEIKVIMKTKPNLLLYPVVLCKILVAFAWIYSILITPSCGVAWFPSLFCILLLQKSVTTKLADSKIFGGRSEWIIDDLPIDLCMSGTQWSVGMLGWLTNWPTGFDDWLADWMRQESKS